ncbi:chemotaxis protein [Epibacterium ulvae]|uniref:Aerotaxis receptor n=1 Tax=Epibacterium ulvae TaxID=1156985 RepID=A0A1G5RIQ2_9RHOB|nr:chemotaxis protein [Epibacterium ulvae]SCZ73924.1 aerotaxis receptor [Epibacterium ulvae]
MSFIDRRIEVRPTTGEAPFALNEVFFSRTDQRGVIEAGNYIFQRVSNYEWDELIGAPHKVIRSPDMPRGVYHLFWETIQQGKTMGAYVKNLAKDGLTYWVYAVVVPCEDGFLSARIKPSSKQFAEIQTLYAKLLKLEQEEGLSPEDSAMLLETWLAEKGFESYHQFAVDALCQELMARDSGLNKPQDSKISSLREMMTNARKLLQETEGLIQDFDAMHTIPHNLRVIASRIEPSGGPVTVLSQNYGAMSREMGDWFSKHVMGKNSNFAAIRASVEESLFIQCMGRVLVECDTQLQSEQRSLGKIDMDKERKILGCLVKSQAKRAQKGMASVDTEAERIVRACQVMHRHFLGLSSTRVLCKIESARLPQSGETLSDIIDQLGAFQERISHRLDRISSLSSEIRSSEEK